MSIFKHFLIVIAALILTFVVSYLLFTYVPSKFYLPITIILLILIFIGIFLSENK